MSKLHKTLLFQKYCRRLECFGDNIFETERVGFKAILSPYTRFKHILHHTAVCSPMFLTLHQVLACVALGWWSINRLSY
jgi:hypothetical protein